MKVLIVALIIIVAAAAAADDEVKRDDVKKDDEVKTDEVKKDEAKKDEEIKKDEVKKDEEIKKEEVKKEEEIKKEEVKKDEVKTEEVKKDEVKTEEVKKDEIKKEEVKKEEVKKEEVKKEEVKKEEVKKEEVKKEEVKKEEVKKEEVKKDEVKKEEVKKEQVKKEEVKKNEVKKDDDTMDIRTITWNSYKRICKRKFSSDDEENDCLKWFKFNLKKAQKHNERHRMGYEAFKMGANCFMDMSIQKFRALRSGYQAPITYTRKPFSVKATFTGYHTLPQQFDWSVNDTTVTEVKNQGDCGSCWAFVTVACLEHLYKKTYGELVDLSEQFLIDCGSSVEYGNYGCNGGRMTNAFNFTAARGIAFKKDYPYKGNDLGDCRSDKVDTVPINKGFDLLIPSELELMRALVYDGPVAVGIDASQASLSLYSSGIYDTWNCNKIAINHAVLLVGYGTMNIRGRPVWYWKIKNSWGKKWGRKGFFYLKRGLNSCGVAMFASVPKKLDYIPTAPPAQESNNDQ